MADTNAVPGSPAPVNYKEIAAVHRKRKELNLQEGYSGFGDRFGHSVGITYASGLIIGSIYGFGTGLQKGGKTTKLRINSLVNEVTHHGPGLGNQLGCMAMFYVGFHKLFTRNFPDYEEYSAPIVGAASGALYKVAHGPVMIGRFALAGAVGFTAIDKIFGLIF